MDFRYLKAFVLTAEFNSFSKAAQKLNIAQSAVSRQIKLLEESLQHELIIRSSKKVLLTQKGKELLLASKQFIEVTQDLFQNESQKTIRVGVLHGLLENWLSSILIKFFKKYKNNLEIEIDNPTGLKKSMEEGKYDVIFSIENIQSELITSLKLFDEDLVLISKAPISLNKIHEHRWITYSDDDYLHQTSKKVSAEILQVKSITTMVNLVKNNIGIAIVPDHTLRSNDNLHKASISGIKKSSVFMSTLNYKTLPTFLQGLYQVIQSSLNS